MGASCVSSTICHETEDMYCYKFHLFPLIYTNHNMLTV